VATRIRIPGNAKFGIAYELEKWKHSLAGSALYGNNNEIKSAERWETRWQSDYKLTERLFAFGALRYEQDHFSGFDYQESITTGLGYKFIDGETTKLSGTLGVGYRRLRPEQLIKDAAGNVVQRIKGEESSDFVGNAGLAYEQQITASTKLIDKFLVEAGSDNTFAQNDFAIEVAMTDILAISLGYGVRHNTDPPPGLEKTDRQTTANLVYNLK
jgi:putative salt-induced outer membrane protein